MSERYDTDFDEALLSGYLDGELTQADQQRVRLRLEGDPDARALLAEMQRIRAAARTTELPTPRDEEWNEAPRSRGSRLLRGVGWVLIGGWLVAAVAVAAWGLATGPELWWQKLLVVAAAGGPVLLFLSVLVDRLKVARHDRYKGVLK